MRDWAEVARVANSALGGNFFGREPAKFADWRRREWDAFENEQPALVATFEFAGAGRYGRCHMSNLGSFVAKDSCRVHAQFTNGNDGGIRS
jgi:hypothetical protein